MHLRSTIDFGLALFLALTLVACSATPAPTVPVSAAPDADLSMLAGRWWGDYGSVESGRHGRIRFTLAADEGLAATGDVLMVPHRIVGTDATSDALPMVTPSTLHVRFVRLETDRVAGALEPYTDPECGCLVSTTFFGRLEGDVIAGTYVSQGGRMHVGHSGRWRVERRTTDDD